jgi:5-methylcytosine-specific restriction enzyme A
VEVFYARWGLCVVWAGGGGAAFDVASCGAAGGGGGAEDRVAMCRTCHKQVHAVYTNKELARELNTVEKPRGAEGLQGYLKWVRKQDAGAVFQVREARRKRG